MKISVITTSYNYDKYISQTIESVLNQTYKDFEYIIFDDGSTDNSLNIIKEYAKKDSRIKVYTHENNANKGLILTMKEAVKKACGEYIVFVESDDMILPDYLEEKIKTSEKYPSAAIIFSQIEPFGDEYRVKKCFQHLEKVQKIISKGYFDYFELFFVNIIPSFSCVMIKKDVISAIPFEFKVSKCFDWYLWNSIILKYDVVFLNKVLTKFRLHTLSFSCKKTQESIFTALLDLSERKYKNKFIYNIFTWYTNRTSFEKLFRKFCMVVDKIIYRLLYVQKTVRVIIEN